MKELSRRAILTAVGLGGAAALSGCGLANSSRPAATATAHQPQTGSNPVRAHHRRHLGAGTKTDRRRRRPGPKNRT